MPMDVSKNARDSSSVHIRNRWWRVSAEFLSISRMKLRVTSMKSLVTTLQRRHRRDANTQGPREKA